MECKTRFTRFYNLIINQGGMTECASASDLNIILFCFILEYLLFYILYSQIINVRSEFLSDRSWGVYPHSALSLWWSKIYILPLVRTIPLHSLLVASVKQLFSFREGLHKLRYWDICFWTTATLVLDRAHRTFFYHPLRSVPVGETYRFFQVPVGETYLIGEKVPAYRHTQ